MSDAYVGQLMLVPFNFPPKGWALCNGALLSISQNTALFSLLGTYYGGNGTSTFGLPNLQGVVPIGQGQGAGLSSYVVGQTGGLENVTLLASNMAPHTHSHMGSTSTASTGSPSGANFASAAQRQSGDFGAAPTPGNKVALNSTALGPAGGSQPHNNIQPTLVLLWAICLQGVYPPRQ